MTGPARFTDDDGFVRLADQDRARWDQSLITEGHELVRACLRRNQPGPFQLEAAIAAVHADAAEASETDWAQIGGLCDQLYAQRPNSVVARNRAIAIGEWRGPADGLRALDEFDTGSLARYQPFHAALADMLVRVGDERGARAAYDRAIALTTNVAEREFLERQRIAAS